MSIDPKTMAARFAAIKVLVVDDQPDIRKVVRALLESIGVRNVYEAASGAAGLELARTVVPDVIVLDWEMPGLDGPGFARTVRSPETFPHPNVPIIMLTGHGERSRVIEAMNVGANEFLLKPVSSKALQDRLISVLLKPRQLSQAGGSGGLPPRFMSGVNIDGGAAFANLTLLN
jgi:two-component system, chemotaxis family, chemotaxis protein CheY